MKNLIENICLAFVIISIIGLIVSLVINNIPTFIFSAFSLIGFWGIALIDIQTRG